MFVRLSPGVFVRGAESGPEQRFGEHQHHAVRLQRSPGAARPGQEERAERPRRLDQARQQQHQHKSNTQPGQNKRAINP